MTCIAKEVDAVQMDAVVRTNDWLNGSDLLPSLAGGFAYRIRSPISITTTAGNTRYWSTRDHQSLLSWSRQLVCAAARMAHLYCTLVINSKKIMPVFLCAAHVTVYELPTMQLKWLMTDKKIAGKTRFMTNNHATWFRQVRT
jgi:hypothetical protein